MKWTELITPETKAKMVELAAAAQAERDAGKTICPPQEQIFAALQLTPPEKVRVCIIGQDPYHTPGQANGLAFSISPGHPLQPSLRNIFKEYREDLGFPQPSCGDLTSWAKQGVLLLNTALTVEAGQANSHAGWGWQAVTADVLRVCSELPQPIVFLAWGRSAQDLIDKYISPYESWQKLMNEKKKAVLKASHPSPFSATRASGGNPAFIGSKPFSMTNKLLEQMGAEPIDWRLE